MSKSEWDSTMGNHYPVRLLIVSATLNPLKSYLEIFVFLSNGVIIRHYILFWACLGSDELRLYIGDCAIELVEESFICICTF